MKSNTSRRDFLKLSGGVALSLPFLTSIKSFANSRPLQNKVKKFVNPAHQDLIFNVRDYGAIGDGTTNDTAALQLAINRCHILGGGEVLVPPGNYLSGAIQLLSNVRLHLEKDAVITGTADFNDYPTRQVRWEGKWIQGHTALIYAIDAKNIGIKGPGKIAGNHALGGRPSKDNPLRHPALIEPINCRKIVFEDFSTEYHSMWSIHPTYCKNIVVKNLHIRSTGGNGDGIDLDSCKNVQIDGCDIATGDDCISLKSGRGMEGYTLRKTTKNVHIQNCKFSDSIFACIGIGSETSGGIRNVLIENCTFYNTKTYALYIKSRPGRGAFIENITARNLDVSGMQGGLLRLNLLGSGIQDQVPVPGNEGIPEVRNFRFSDVKVKDVAILVAGSDIHPSKPLEGFELKNVSGTCNKGITLANINNANIENINISGYSGPLLNIFQVKGKGLQSANVIEMPYKLPEEIAIPDQPYQLK